ncbi:MAG TPA: class I tRNA ligase family protein, partial [Patescibacteria group bacterium]|nr:class I tRNA ligase family protein [Patescibacteria group bacterium]
VVMNPKDKRYKKYKQGDTFEAEWINGKVTATVIKDEAVDPTFGTGVMTITPWHDQTDFYIAEKHKLDKEQIIDLKGRLLPIAGEFADMTIEEVRPKVVEKLRSKGLLSRVEENYTHSIALNSRGKGIIEPQIRLQWFIDVNKKVVNWKNKKLSLKEVMQSVIREGDIKLIPSRYEKNYFHWVDNLRDWCISRQIWWGHRIPVWYRTDTDGRHETYVGVIPPTDQNEGRHEWEQDHDTLDTWFSSALWTWSTLIDQELANDYKLSLDTLLKKSLDFQTYHPTTVMETGWDILYFWVTRMILATTYVTGEIPFKKVYLHGLVRTEAGQKMSKSHPDTIIDPLEVIPEYGTDALRLALVQGMSAGNDQRLGISKIITNRNFCNKLWNIARFVESTPKNSDDEIKLSTIYDHWIIDRLNECQESIKTDLDKFLFSEAYDKIYHFIWHDFADWYVEASKDSPNSILLSYVLKQSLVLIHPFAPFISEAIWQTINNSDKSLLASETFTSLIKYELAKANQFEIVKSVISESRYLQKVLNAKKPAMNYQKSQLITDNIKMIKRLAYLKDIKEVSKGQGIKLTLVKENIWLDIDKSKTVIYLKDVSEKNKIQEKIVSNLKNRLSNKKYLTSAPEDIIIQTKDQLSVAEEVLLNLQNEIKRFKS